MHTDERAVASAAIGQAVNAILDGKLRSGDTLALYAAKGTEVATTAIAEHAMLRGIEIAYPRVLDDDRTLMFHLVGADELIAGRFGLREPRADSPAVALERIAAFVIPGLGFDLDGGRVGWGRGYYDVTLAKAPSALRIGVAFACQVVDRLPRDPHDVPMSYVITELATHEVG